MKKSSEIKGDLLLILFCLLAAAVFALCISGGDETVTAVIYSGGEAVREIDLSSVRQPYEFRLGQTVIRVEQGRICYKQAPCPDKLCMRCGWLSQKGDTAACVPEKTAITLKGSGKVHAVTY